MTGRCFLASTRSQAYALSHGDRVEQSGVTPGVHRWPRDDVVFGPEAPDWHQGQVWVTDSAPAPAAVAAPGPWWTDGSALVDALACWGGSTLLSAAAKQ